MLTQQLIFQHGLVDHTANTKAPLDNGEIFLYSRSWLVGKRNRCWIKGLGKNPQKEWALSLFVVLLSGVSEVWPAGLRENGMSAKVRVWISRIMPQNVETRPPFYSWEKFCMYTRQPTQSGLKKSQTNFKKRRGIVHWIPYY